MRRWIGWIPGVALLALVVGASLHIAEAGEFARIVEQAEPAWLAFALLLQLATYPAAGQVFRIVLGAGAHALPLPLAWRAALAKLFVDQALPSAGISGTVLFAGALEQRGVPRRVVAAAVVVDLVSYFAAYVACLGIALALAFAHEEAGELVAFASLGFVVFALALCVLLLRVSGRGSAAVPAALRWIRPLHGAVSYIARAEPALARNPALLLRAGLCHVAIMLLDAGTVWALLHALGVAVEPGAVFAGFMIANLLRSIAVVPGGLGAFEGASVLALHSVGVPMAVALAATLLFRGLGFWLPMLPGAVLARNLLRAPARAGGHGPASYWALDQAQVLAELHASPGGLGAGEAAERLQRVGRNELRTSLPLTRLDTLWNQLRSPLLLLLLFAALVSAFTGEWVDATIVTLIVLATVGVGYSREFSAQSAAEALGSRVRTCANVLRDGTAVAVPLAEVVPGDVVLLAAGSIVPADCLVLEATDCHASEAVLTGESYPVPKRAGVCDAGAPLARRENCVFMGTNVRSGTARCVVVATGLATEFGAIAHRLSLRPPETEFDRGIRRFGYLLTSAMLAMVLVVFAVHTLGGRPATETLLFAIALAVGLSPELLPAILTVNLSRGASMMARHGVLVRHLNAIENLGSMDVLCTDKTGTLTEGVVQLEGAYDPQGSPSTHALEVGALNAALETGLPSPLDDAILQAHPVDAAGHEKLAEIPFDFLRKRVSVVVRDGCAARLLTKGAFRQVLEACTRLADGSQLDDAARDGLETLYAGWSAKGMRVLALATRQLPEKTVYSRADEIELCFAGFLCFLDRPKEGAAEAVRALGDLGVSVKLITGDGRIVSQHVARLVGLDADRVLTGAELDALNDEALWHAAERTALFVEVDPNQKERILLALKKTGHVVGFLGDGVNDAPAMHAADTSLSVEHAVDVARAAADFVLLDRHLDVIRRGIEEGRKTFANTLKYVLTTTSANLGNMASMALASLFLPFLPLLASQILLNNFLSDIPAVGIADDNVDPELIERPRRWDMGFIRRFMIEFGALSSAFDLLTFAVLLGVFRASPELFRTGWFVESLLTELVVALVVRTRRRLFRSRPGRVLLVSTLVLVPVTFLIPYLPYAGLLGFVPMPPALVATLVAITVAYVLATEWMKNWFYRNGNNRA